MNADVTESRTGDGKVGGSNTTQTTQNEEIDIDNI
jgi:hypothetical protein